MIGIDELRTVVEYERAESTPAEDDPTWAYVIGEAIERGEVTIPPLPATGSAFKEAERLLQKYEEIRAFRRDLAAFCKKYGLPLES